MIGGEFIKRRGIEGARTQVHTDAEILKDAPEEILAIITGSLRGHSDLTRDYSIFADGQTPRSGPPRPPADGASRAAQPETYRAQ